MLFRAIAACLLVCLVPAAAGSPVRVVVSFTILKDIAQEIGGSDVAVTSLIGRDRDPHSFEPTPDQARLLSHVQLFIVNGLGFEGWLLRLTNSARYHGPVIVATQGITPITTTGPGGGVSVPDPHA